MAQEINSILKGRSPFPFESIATAISFSPNTKMLLGESIKLCKQFSANLILIHVGQKDVEKEYELNQLLKHFNTDGITIKAIWEEGDTVDVILKICKENVVDLLVAGALKKENFWTFYKGSVARKLCRQAKCSLLILTEPKMEGTDYNTIVVNGVEHPKTLFSIKTSFYFAKHMNVNAIDVVEEIDPSKVKTTVEDDETCEKAKAERDRIINEERVKMQDLLSKEMDFQLQVKFDCLFGKLGYTIGHYTEMKKADLLVVNSPNRKLGLLDRVFTHDLEYLLAEMPTNMLIVHSRGFDN
ncbi:universal stress protein [Flavobacteriales bacterium]|nr:universal stress protein [Flavobacteriales bacterium]